MFIQSLNGHSDTQYITTRFGNVLGSNGSVIPRFRNQIKKGGPITVTHPDITRYFMTIPEASQLVLEAGSMGQGGEIYLFDMGEPVKILDVAEKLIKLSGLQPYDDIDIQFTGLRPGEKLYEELLNDTELSKATHHSKITIANIEKSNFNSISKQIAVLLLELDNVDNKNHIVYLMKQIVPDFKSKNSIFESLDTEEVSQKV
jgi:FlaA1/EpsC-like NDP-sugar epimerase